MEDLALGPSQFKASVNLQFLFERHSFGDIDCDSK